MTRGVLFIDLVVSVKPSELKLSHEDLEGTFGKFELEQAVAAILNPSKVAGLWVAPSWLDIAVWIGWTEADEERLRLDGRQNRFPAMGELGLRERPRPDLQHDLGVLMHGLDALKELDWIEVTTGLEPSSRSTADVDFVWPKPIMIEELVEHQAAKT